MAAGMEREIDNEVRQSINKRVGLFYYARPLFTLTDLPTKVVLEQWNKSALADIAELAPVQLVHGDPRELDGHHRKNDDVLVWKSICAI